MYTPSRRTFKVVIMASMKTISDKLSHSGSKCALEAFPTKIKTKSGKYTVIVFFVSFQQLHRCSTLLHFLESMCVNYLFFKQLVN